MKTATLEEITKAIHEAHQMPWRSDNCDLCARAAKKVFDLLKRNENLPSLDEVGRRLKKWRVGGLGFVGKTENSLVVYMYGPKNPDFSENYPDVFEGYKVKWHFNIGRPIAE